MFSLTKNRNCLFGGLTPAVFSSLKRIPKTLDKNFAECYNEHNIRILLGVLIFIG